jgi:hypothetical protein
MAVVNTPYPDFTVVALLTAVAVAAATGKARFH